AGDPDRRLGRLVDIGAVAERAVADEESSGCVLVGELEADGDVAFGGFGAVESDAEVVDEEVEAHRPDGVGAGRVWRREDDDAVAELLGGGEVEVAPRA